MTSNFIALVYYLNGVVPLSLRLSGAMTTSTSNSGIGYDDVSRFIRTLTSLVLGKLLTMAPNWNLN